MKFAIITTTKNKASMNIKKFLESYDLENCDIYTVNEETIYLEGLDKLDADFFIFATKHKSDSKIKTLTVHISGNWGKAELGGKDNCLNMGSALMLKKAFLLLNEHNLDYEVSLEVTHHGPVVNKPHFFIEIGSSEKEWADEKAAEVVAKVIRDVINRKDLENQKIAIGIGGNHYCPNFNKILLESDVALSHICPKYNLIYLNEKMLKEIINKTKEKVDFALLDWKGLGKEKVRIISLLEDLKIKYKKTKDF